MCEVKFGLDWSCKLVLSPCCSCSMSVDTLTCRSHSYSVHTFLGGSSIRCRMQFCMAFPASPFSRPSAHTCIFPLRPATDKVSRSTEYNALHIKCEDKGHHVAERGA